MTADFDQQPGGRRIVKLILRSKFRFRFPRAVRTVRGREEIHAAPMGIQVDELLSARPRKFHS